MTILIWFIICHEGSPYFKSFIFGSLNGFHPKLFSLSFEYFELISGTDIGVRMRGHKPYESSGSESGTLERPIAGTGGTSTFTGGPSK